MIKSISSYKSIIFDCDGVILDSNPIKTNAFYKVALAFGHDSATKLVEYHKGNGGISRYKKFEYFITNILEIELNRSLLETLTNSYSLEVMNELLLCSIAENFFTSSSSAFGSKWFVVSGGDQTELREVFACRGLLQYFDGGVHGSPKSKEDIIAQLITLKELTFPVLFIGDSKYDYKVSQDFGFDFVFMSNWTEVTNWEEWVLENGITHFPGLQYLC
jgi:phosphoglycolate phosphatase-like HAD superfamily hydrolase